jgi:hypothetical protein
MFATKLGATVIVLDIFEDKIVLFDFLFGSEASVSDARFFWVLAEVNRGESFCLFVWWEFVWFSCLVVRGRSGSDDEAGASCFEVVVCCGDEKCHGGWWGQAKELF